MSHIDLTKVTSLLLSGVGWVSITPGTLHATQFEYGSSESPIPEYRGGSALRFTIDDGNLPDDAIGGEVTVQASAVLAVRVGGSKTVRKSSPRSRPTTK